MSRRLRIDDLTELAVPEQPALSPDAGRCAYVLRELDADEDRVLRSIWCVGDGQPRRLTRGPADSAPAWAPDGSAIAFLRATDGPAQLWLLPADGGEPEQLTTLPLGAGAPVWSGTALASLLPRRPIHPTKRRRSSPTASTTSPTAPATSGRSASTSSCSTRRRRSARR